MCTSVQQAAKVIQLWIPVSQPVMPSDFPRTNKSIWKTSQKKEIYRKTSPKCVGRKIQQIEKLARKSNKESGGKSEKTSPKWASLHKYTPNTLLAVNSNNKSASKFEKEQSAKQTSTKTSPKNKKISNRTSPKTSNPQVFKNIRNSTKKQAQICGKTVTRHMLAVLVQVRCA